MTEAPLVSIIIPAYNAERWIGATLDSCVSQTWENIEVIVVDDGSSDQTSRAADATRDPRVQLFRQDHNGAAAARNRGLEEALGDLIQFLDADDLLSSDKLEKQIEALREEQADAVASCAWGSFVAAPETATIATEPVWPIADPVKWLTVSLSGGGMMQPAGWLTPRSVADAAGPWDESLTLHDDGEYFARVLLKASLNVFVPEAKVYYRIVADSLSNRRSRAATESALAVCRSRERHLLAACDTSRVRRALATQYAQFAYEFVETAPDLANDALGAIRALGVRPVPVIGGRSFRVLSSTVGFERALRLRAHV